MRVLGRAHAGLACQLDEFLIGRPVPPKKTPAKAFHELREPRNAPGAQRQPLATAHMTITQLAHVATHHGHGAVVTLAAVIIGAGLLLPRLLAPALKAESGADPAGERGRRSSEDSEASTSSSSDESDVFEEHSALFRVAEVAPHVQQSQVTIPRRRRGRRTVNIFLRTLTPTQVGKTHVL